MDSPTPPDADLEAFARALRIAELQGLVGAIRKLSETVKEGFWPGMILIEEIIERRINDLIAPVEPKRIVTP